MTINIGEAWEGQQIIDNTKCPDDAQFQKQWLLKKSIIWHQLFKSRHTYVLDKGILDEVEISTAKLGTY
jgi:hypothetical protein